MTSKILGRLSLLLGAALLVALFAWEACSQELSIIQVRRNIPLADEDPVIRDIYINGGSESGLKNNMIIQATRKTIIKDATGSQSLGELIVPVAQLKVVFVGPKISVARDHKPANLDSTPVLDQVGVQIGDRIELNSK